MIEWSDYTFSNAYLSRALCHVFSSCGPVLSCLQQLWNIISWILKSMIPSCKEVEILGVTFQCDSKFSVLVKNKLIKANKSLHILRTLRKEGYNQSEIDLLFNTIVLPNINYAVSVYAASESDLTPVQCFLNRCFKRKYTISNIQYLSL